MTASGMQCRRATSSGPLKSTCHSALGRSRSKRCMAAGSMGGSGRHAMRPCRARMAAQVRTLGTPPACGGGGDDEEDEEDDDVLSRLLLLGSSRGDGG